MSRPAAYARRRMPWAAERRTRGPVLYCTVSLLVDATSWQVQTLVVRPNRRWADEVRFANIIHGHEVVVEVSAYAE